MIFKRYIFLLFCDVGYYSRWKRTVLLKKISKKEVRYYRSKNNFVESSK